MTEESPNDSWAKALRLYDSLVAAGWRHIPTFRQLVSDISRCSEAWGLSAVTSHETLTITPYTRYPDWMDGRRVRVHPNVDGSVHLDKVPRDGDGQPTETWTVPMDQALAKVRELISDL